MEREESYMAKPPYDGITALRTLRDRLDEAASLEVIHPGGHVWKAYFTFKPSAAVEEIEVVKQEMQISLPPAYERFLGFSNGALLYHDKEYGQWGFRLYSTQELFLANVRRRKPYGDAWPTTYLIFAESLGDSDLLVLDVSQPIDGGDDCHVIDGDSGYLPHEWRSAARSFGKWLDRLVVAQGAKYWRWY